LALPTPARDAAPRPTVEELVASAGFVSPYRARILDRHLALGEWSCPRQESNVRHTV
jgi:hypothetical protein